MKKLVVFIMVIAFSAAVFGQNQPVKKSEIMKTKTEVVKPVIEKTAPANSMQKAETKVVSAKKEISTKANSAKTHSHKAVKSAAKNIKADASATVKQTETKAVETKIEKAVAAPTKK